MTGSDIRSQWHGFQSRVSREATESKQSQGALFDLFERYRSLDPTERAAVDRLLAEDVLSDSELERYDAEAMIREFQIRSALPSLRRLADRLEADDSPGAPYEWAKVNKLISALDHGPSDVERD